MGANHWTNEEKRPRHGSNSNRKSHERHVTLLPLLKELARLKAELKVLEGSVNERKVSHVYYTYMYMFMSPLHMQSISILCLCGCHKFWLSIIFITSFLAHHPTYSVYNKHTSCTCTVHVQCLYVYCKYCGMESYFYCEIA